MRIRGGHAQTYQYDSNRRWLANIRTGTGFETFQSIDYQFDRVGNILSTVNSGTTRSSSQSYTYDDRYQLVSAVGTTTTTLGGLTLEENHYTQRYRYDVIGNMTAKTSTNHVAPTGIRPSRLNYDLTYTYDPARPHQATRIGELSYRYDPNGNLTQVYDPTTTTNPTTPPAPPPREDLGPYRGSAPEAFGRYRWNESAEPEEPIAGYRWNEDNRLTQSTTGDNVVTDYRYDAQGTRRVKYSRVYGETLYADRMYQEHVGTNPTAAVTKHIFVGQTRIASKLHYTDQTPSTRALYMQQNTFYYHPDHLGSTNWVTDHQGEGYEHFTYTPYGEVWVEEHLSSKIHRMSHRFTGQELDPETGLYAFPARNYDPRTSRWLSADPALSEYLPVAPTSDQAREHNQNLPGGGGVFVHVNLAVYHYSANNPLRYVDPDGRQTTPPPSIRNYMDQERMQETIGALAEIIFALGMVQGSENSVDATTGPAPQVEVSTGGDGERRITLFRAVNPRELASIEASGGVFSLDPRGGGAESKYFTLIEGNAKEFAKEANQFFGDGPYTVVGTTFPENELTPDMFFTATDIPGGLESVAIPKKKLPLLTPAIKIETVE